MNVGPPHSALPRVELLRAVHGIAREMAGEIGTLNQPGFSLNQLENHLWESANILRGPVDAADFKTYIFPMLFFKRICDVWDEEYQEMDRNSLPLDIGHDGAPMKHFWRKRSESRRWTPPSPVRARRMFVARSAAPHRLYG